MTRISCRGLAWSRVMALAQRAGPGDLVGEYLRIGHMHGGRPGEGRLPGRGEITVHLPGGWHRETEWINLFEAACGPPAQAA